MKRWCRRYDITRAVTLTLDPGKTDAATLQPFMRPGISAAARMEQCSRWTWRHDEKTKTARYVQTYAGGTEEEREDLRRAFILYINYLWNKARTQITKRHPMQYVRVVELHSDSVRPHLHLLVNRYIPWAIWQHVWTAAGGGSRIEIHRIRGKVDDATAYIMKYMTKAAYSANPSDWPRGSRRIVVSRGLSLTLNPEEKEQLEAYRKAGKTLDSPCIDGFTPESLEGNDYSQCSRCVWKKRRVCKYRPPGVVPWQLYDERRGILVFPVCRSNEEEIDRAWWTWATRQAYRKIPWWARGDRRTEEMMFSTVAARIMGEADTGFTIDPYLYKVNNAVIREEE